MASLLPLGLANACILLYIGTPTKDDDGNKVIGSSVYLLEMCLYIGGITVVMSVIASITKIALIVSLSWESLAC